ncbi:hypothetical protein CC80DRAFT_553513 [Byssothecium circinans]|uniref:Uncharacterized protein n=1 Tax=Byssothecium circinans TaxID=147558 RepID=A0A6A5TEU0_9PLEO|nr:hypothetical protein CC80DRAFT_553513 [Byssothecium circinans]
MKALSFHFSPSVAATRASNVFFTDFARGRIRNTWSAERFLCELFHDLWIPQTITFLTKQCVWALRERKVHDANDGEAAESVKEKVHTWAQGDDPFLWNNYEPVLRLFRLGSTAPLQEPMETRRDIAQALFFYCKKPTLRSAIQNMKEADVTPEAWMLSIAVALDRCNIQCIPRSAQRLTFSAVIRLVGSTALSVPTSAKGSLKRQATDSMQRIHANAKIPRTGRMLFSRSQPMFPQIPDTIAEGFQYMQKTMKSVKRAGSDRVCEHYSRAEQVLSEHLADTECELLLMIVITFASLPKVPVVDEGSCSISYGHADDISY